MIHVVKFSILIPVALAIVFAMNYGLAQLGEPRALWLMQIIGVM